jgi:hypothetical protein
MSIDRPGDVAAKIIQAHAAHMREAERERGNGMPVSYNADRLEQLAVQLRITLNEQFGGPIKWEPDSRMEIPGKGLVMAGTYPFNGAPADAVGKVLDVAGEHFVVRGVEYRGPFVHGSKPKVGLLVRHFPSSRE